MLQSFYWTVIVTDGVITEIVRLEREPFIQNLAAVSCFPRNQHMLNNCNNGLKQIRPQQYLSHLTHIWTKKKIAGQVNFAMLNGYIFRWDCFLKGNSWYWSGIQQFWDNSVTAVQGWGWKNPGTIQKPPPHWPTSTIIKYEGCLWVDSQHTHTYTPVFSGTWVESACFSGWCAATFITSDISVLLLSIYCSY